MKKFYTLLISFLGITLFIGCTDIRNNTAKKNIETVLRTQFTSADEELISLWEENLVITRDGIKDEIPDETSENKLNTYLTNTYKQYFSVNALNSFISNDGLLYQIMAATAEYHMFVDSITVTKTDSNHDSYQVSITVHYQKENEELKRAIITGFVSVNKKGEITRINILDDDNLYTTFITNI